MTESQENETITREIEKLLNFLRELDIQLLMEHRHLGGDLVGDAIAGCFELLSLLLNACVQDSKSETFGSAAFDHTSLDKPDVFREKVSSFLDETKLELCKEAPDYSGIMVSAQSIVYTFRNSL